MLSQANKSCQKVRATIDEYLQANQKPWDQLTLEHQFSAFYDLAGFKAGKDRLRSIDLTELGDVAGKTLLHLQCHFGMDTLAWTRTRSVTSHINGSRWEVRLTKVFQRKVEGCGAISHSW